jgi:N-acetylglucosamine-6-phosphate deacetylase
MPDGTLSGSSLTMLQAVQNCVTHCHITLPDALQMASTYPARLMGIENLTGEISLGQPADLLLLDENLNLKEVIFKGEIVSN